MSKLEIKYDKKQMPQLVGLGVLTVGLFGYVSFTLLAPTHPASASAAASPSAPVSSLAAHVGATASAAPAADPDTASLIDGTPPSSTMKDPFVPVLQNAAASTSTSTVTPPVTKPVPSTTQLSPLAPMPASQSIQALPTLPAASTQTAASSSAPATPTALQWSVTGVLAGPGGYNRIAVLRNAEARRFVALGEMVDDHYRLIGIDRFGVTLSDGHNRIRLLLGSDPSAPSTSTTSSVLSSQVSVPANSEINLQDSASNVSVPIPPSASGKDSQNGQDPTGLL